MSRILDSIVVFYPFFVLFVKVGRWMLSTIYNMRPSLEFRLFEYWPFMELQKKKANKQIDISRLVFFGFFILTSNAIWKSEKQMLLWLFLNYDRSFDLLAKFVGFQFHQWLLINLVLMSNSWSESEYICDHLSCFFLYGICWTFMPKRT